MSSCLSVEECGAIISPAACGVNGSVRWIGTIGYGPCVERVELFTGGASDGVTARPGTPHYVPMDPVEWLSPGVLFGSALEVALAGQFGRFADKRELLAVEEAMWWDASAAADPKKEFWFDFASDTGDGHPATSAIAKLLATDAPKVSGLEGGKRLPRGRLVVLGGDQVYPSANWEDYQSRFVGPYSAALEPSEDPAGPRMFALPGNHDWYDGLTSFLRLFCQQGWIGGWRTEQTRSYFAIKLPGGWWLWAIDTQFDTYIDEPQLEYFKALPSASEGQPGIVKGDRVILVTAKPSWVHVPPRTDDPKGKAVERPWRTLAFFEQKMIVERGARLALTLTGDIHHYARYRSEVIYPPTHKVTAGGAGAYMSATHWLPDELDLPSHAHLPPGERTGGVQYKLQKTYPDRKRSEEIAGKVLGLWRWERSLDFGVAVGVIYALFALLIGAALKDNDDAIGPSLSPSGDGRNVVDLVGDALSIWVLLLAGLLVLLLFALAKHGKVENQLRAALGHAFEHLVIIVPLTIVGLWGLDQLLPGVADRGFWVGYAMAGVLFVVGVFPGRSVIAHYFLRENLREGPDGRKGLAHSNEVFAALSGGEGQGHKHILRFRIANGTLAAFAIGIRDPVDAPDTYELIDLFESQ